MIVPLLSVTLIGVVVAMRQSGSRSLRAGTGQVVIGAWAGFLLGAVATIVVDVFTGIGPWVTLVGHLGAYLGAKTSAEPATELTA
ncbi:MAG: hypothetical protein S0880_16055 [Actinomycetota bacterium]|nr:hypothetical protein [Actinomycetota bacterium]